jgi:hypothetical protein
MLPRASFSVPLIVVALLAVTIQPTSAGVDASSGYRYAGVVGNGRGIPTHYLKRGEGVVFYFFDSFSRGRKSEPYRLCVGPPRKAAVHCWKQTAKYGVGKLSFPFTLPSSVPLGEMTARWLVADRTVASWAFYHARAD